MTPAPPIAATISPSRSGVTTRGVMRTVLVAPSRLKLHSQAGTCIHGPWKTRQRCAARSAGFFGAPDRRRYLRGAENPGPAGAGRPATKGPRGGFPGPHKKIQVFFFLGLCVPVAFVSHF